jgi:hypothetical protein
MPRAFTGTQLIARIRNLSDTESQTARHPDANILEHISQSYQAMREIVSRAGHGYFVTDSAAVTVANTATVAIAPIAGGSVSVGRVYGVSVLVGTEPLALYELPLEDRDAWGSQAGIPVAFRVTNAAGAEVLRLFPTPDAVYTLTITHLPPATVISAAGTSIDGIFGWDDWVCWDVAVKLASRDGRDQDAAAYRAERAECEARMRSDASHRVRTAHPMTRQDTRRRKLRGEEWSRLTWLRRP